MKVYIVWGWGIEATAPQLLKIYSRLDSAEVHIKRAQANAADYKYMIQEVMVND